MKKDVIVYLILIILLSGSISLMKFFFVAAGSQGNTGISLKQSNSDPVDWWPTFHHDLSHLGISTSTAPITNQTLWNYTTGGAVYSSPAVADGVVYVGSSDGKIYALNANTGTLMWSYLTGYAVGPSSPAVVNGVLYTGTEGNNAYALNASTGSKIWSYTTGNAVESSPAVAGSVVYVGSDDHKVYALNAATGAQLWNYTTGSYAWSSPAVADGVVYVGSFDDNVYALNATTGMQLWNYTTGREVDSSPAVAGGVVYFGSEDNKVYALNATTGAQLWNYTTGSGVRSSPAVAGGVVYVGSLDNKVYALNAASGALVWNYTTGNPVSSSPAVASGVVYLGSFDDKVYALNATTGAQLWNYTTGSYVDSSPAVADGVVYLGSRDGKVYAFGTPPLSVLPPSASNSVIDGSHPSPVLTCGAVFGGTPPYTYQWFKMNPDLSYSMIPGATSSNYTFSPNDANTTGVWTFEVQATDSAGVPATVTSDPLSVTSGQKVPAPAIQTWSTANGIGDTIESYSMSFNQGVNFTSSWNVREYNESQINPINNQPYGLTVSYQGNTLSDISGTQLLFQFTLQSATNENPLYPHIYINCPGGVIPISLLNCSSFDMVTSNVTYVGNVPTFTNVITFHDIALQTYGHEASTISLVFTQHFIADWTELKVETETYADLTNMTLYYSNQSAVPPNTEFSLNFDYMVALINNTASNQLGHTVFIIPSSMTQTGLYFNVEGLGGMQYSLADLTLEDNYTEVQGAAQVPNKTATAYFAPGWVSGSDCIQSFTNLTYNVTTAIRSDPTISVMHSQIPLVAVPEFPTVIATTLFLIALTVTMLFIKRRNYKSARALS